MSIYGTIRRKEGPPGGRRFGANPCPNPVRRSDSSPLRDGIMGVVGGICTWIDLGCGLRGSTSRETTTSRFVPEGEGSPR